MFKLALEAPPQHWYITFTNTECDSNQLCGISWATSYPAGAYGPANYFTFDGAPFNSFFHTYGTTEPFYLEFIVRCRDWYGT